MKTKEELYITLLGNKDKIPEDIWNIYLLKKKKVNWLKIFDYNYKEKIEFLKWFTNELNIFIKNKYIIDDYVIWAWESNVDNGNSFSIGYRTMDNKISSPFNIEISIPLKYYYIEQYRKRELTEKEKILLKSIKIFLEEKWYKPLLLEIAKMETDIIWTNNIPFKEYWEEIISIYDPSFNSLSLKEQIEYISETDYEWPYTIYNVVFWEHW